jgi:hypothetical protein
MPIFLVRASSARCLQLLRRLQNRSTQLSLTFKNVLKDKADRSLEPLANIAQLSMFYPLFFSALKISDNLVFLINLSVVLDYFALVQIAPG